MLGEFLRLLQAVEAGRKCEGRECILIRDGDVDGATATDHLRLSHGSDHENTLQLGGVCPTCLEIERQENTLRESLHTQGIDMPLEVLVDLTPHPV